MEFDTQTDKAIILNFNNCLLKITKLICLNIVKQSSSFKHANSYNAKILITLSNPEPLDDDPNVHITTRGELWRDSMLQTRLRPYLCVRFLLLCSLLLNVVACTKAPNIPVTETPVTQTTIPPSQAPSIGEEADEPVVITFAAYEDERQLYEPLMAEFNRQHPDVTVQFVSLPQQGTNYNQQRATMADTFNVWGFDFSENYYYDVQPLLEADSTFNADDFWPGALDSCQSTDGRFIGLPTVIEVEGIYYDKQAFDNSSLPYPQPGWTWGEFRDLAIALSRQDGNSARYGFAANQANMLVHPLLEAALVESDGEINLDALQNAAQWYLDLINLKAVYPSPDSAEDGENIVSLFTSQNRPVMWSGSLGAAMPGTQSEGNTSLDNMALQKDGFVPYPIAADGSVINTTPIATSCMAISKGTQHPREAWIWLDFLSRQWLVESKTALEGRFQIPGRMSVADHEGFWDGLPAELNETIRFAIEHGYNRFVSTYPDTFSQVVDAFNKAASGKGNFLDILANIEIQESSSEDGALDTPLPTTQVVVATPKPTLSSDVTTIAYFYEGGLGDSVQLETAVAAYNEAHPDTVVQLSTTFAWTNWMEDVSANFDCFTGAMPNWSLQSADLVLSLNNLVEAEQANFLQDFYPGILGDARYQGELYSLPAFSQPTIIAYNADLLARRGLTFPSLDWTFNDLVDLATQVASTTEGDRSYGMVVDIWSDLFSAGREVNWADFQSDPPVTYFDSPDVLNYFEWLSVLQSNHVVLVQTRENWTETGAISGIDQVGFWVALAGDLTLGYGSEPTYKIGIAPMPLMNNYQPLNGNWANEQGHFISKGAKNPQACWNWLKYLSEQTNIFPGIPARMSVANSSTWETLVSKDIAEVYRASMDRQKPASNLASEDASYNRIIRPLYSWWRLAIETMANGNDYRELLPTIQRKAEDYLVCISMVDRNKLSTEELDEEVSQCVQQVGPED